MTIYALDELLDTSSTDSQVPDSEESNVSADTFSSAEIYEAETVTEFQSELDSSEEQGSVIDAVTETTSYTEQPDYSGTLEAIEADAHVILYVLLLFLVILFLFLTYKLYNFIMR